VAKDSDNPTEQPAFDFDTNDELSSAPPARPMQHKEDPSRSTAGKRPARQPRKPSVGQASPAPNDGSDVDRQLLVTIPQASKILCLSRTTLYELMWRGELPPIHIGRSVRFAVTQLETFVSDRIVDKS